MDYLIEFYKGLDSINLLLFWGVIIVITLLLIFSIIMVNKNRELKLLIAEREKRKKNNDEIPIKVAETHEVKVTPSVVDAPIKAVDKMEEKPVEIVTPPVTTTVEPQIKTVDEAPKAFVAEEYIMNYHEKPLSVTEKVTPPMPEIKEVPIVEKVTPKPVEEKPQVVTPTMPYQRNVLREMSLNQTSPIGINQRNDAENLEHARAEELNQSLNTNNVETNNQQYLNEVSSKLNKAINDVERTAYEIQQEEDAIISYNELLKKRDSIKTIEEEEAVISIEELYRKEKSKLYGITEEEEDNKFIDELKNFRDDL